MTLRNSSRSVALRPPFCGWSRSGLWSGTWWSGSRKSRSYGLHILAALGEGDKWALLEVLFEELAEPLIDLGTLAGCLTRFQRLSSLGFGGVTLDGGDPDPESAGRLGLGHTSLYGIHDLLTEVFGVRFHQSMMPCSPSSSQHAVRSTDGRCSGGAVAIGIPSSCSPLETAASSLAINAWMRSHSFNTNANLSISSYVMPSAPCPLCRRVDSKNPSSTPRVNKGYYSVFRCGRPA